LSEIIRQNMFKEIKPEELNESAIRLIGKDNFLITAGVSGDFNTMTAGWGGIGYLWNKPVVFIFVRPTRHTYSFNERFEHFSISFFSEQYRDILDLCGSRSGRDTDKIKETGLKPVEYEHKTIYFEQANVNIICRKIYFQDIDPHHFIDKNIEKMYPLKDYHRMYAGEIEKVLMKKE
jgi:flavin reductase (DIM6/NTAB) family NADH-FMN oxidoreductase RutF